MVRHLAVKVSTSFSPSSGSENKKTKCDATQVEEESYSARHVRDVLAVSKKTEQGSRQHRRRAIKIT